MNQLKLDIPRTPSTRLVCGGIYTPVNPDDVDPLAPYAICFGRDAFCFIFDGMEDIEEIVELACAHKMKLVEGYALAIVKFDVVTKEKNMLQIRDSGKKGKDDYVIWKGKYCDAWNGKYEHKNSFEESMKKYLKIFHK